MLANSKLRGAGTVAVLDLNNFHDEVHGAVLWSLQQFAGLDVRLYRPVWRWYFEHSISSFWSSQPRDPQLLIADLRKDHSIRHLIMTTSDWDFGKLGGELEAAWDERPHDAKFDITAIRHWAGDTNRFTGMAERGALALLGLGDHVANNLRQSVDELVGARREAGYDRAADAWGKVKIRTFIPVFPAGRFPHVGDSIFDPRPDGSNSMDMVVIQSTHFNQEHRNMNEIFTVLNSSLHEDPALWGYAPPNETTPRFTPLPDTSGVFKLYTVGATQSWPPEELSEVVMSRTSYAYPHFYAAMHAADLILPAFGGRDYETSRASSTMGVAGSSDVPILVSETQNAAYGWFCPAFGILRPDDMPEMEYVKLVRQGIIPWPTRGERERAMQDCMDAWTATNMDLWAELFTE
ncbi:hypothetical protein EHS25_006135 [Saitozyma podzolica]|uniref:Uncharacterized protein n=1 Tax=Saitozyma podzolica TaxID=1890683 RepID=A0A427XTH2_9TREE|nr:hypothetical protein EHS25_006135 [Saitozyma podzolica]